MYLVVLPVINLFKQRLWESLVMLLPLSVQLGIVCSAQPAVDM
jgi:hypothetical protein